MIAWLLIPFTLVVLVLLGAILRRRGMDLWLLPYLLSGPRKPPAPGEPIDVIICIADHFEPASGGVTPEAALARVDRWRREYPALFGQFRDSDGRPPRHTFFFPIEEYDEPQVELLGELCRSGYGEVEIHLHHDNDCSENLRATLESAVRTFSLRHGMLARDRQTGRVAYGFVHGNWALDNSRPDGRWCGVNDEIDVLRETGCYADFTFPSAPSRTQPRKINSIYYAVDDPERPRSHERGIDVGRGQPPARGLMLIQGPLVLDWRRGRWGAVPKTENACLQSGQFPHIDRLDSWLRARVQVPRRPDWFFVKLHAHGAYEHGRKAVLDEPMVRFHQDLADRASRDPAFRYHYVTAREMYNLVKAAEDGWPGSVLEALDYRLEWIGKEPAVGAPPGYSEDAVAGVP
ncbi:MAG: hypothetical protein U0790_18585 [Isosphaeraceae bacterium]